MKRFRNFVLAGLIFFLIVGSFWVGLNIGSVSAQDEFSQKFQIYFQVLNLLRSQYFEKNLNETNIIYGSIRGMLAALDDPYTRFMDPKSYQEMKIRMRGSFSGIGIQIGIKDNLLRIIAPLEGTPAYKAGLKSLDIIVTIDDKPTRDMSLDEAVSLIRGEKGTSVRLGIVRGDETEPKEYKIVREIIKIESLKTKILQGGIGYLKLITFENENTAYDVKKALAKLEQMKIKGLIFDLRNNGGGLLQNAIEIADLLIPKGQIVSTVDRDGNKQTEIVSGKSSFRKPLVVLINEASASASEILAGAIADNKIGVTVGTHTFGKASVQNVRPLTDGSAVLITVAKYFTPNGRDISKKGIAPDVLVELPKKEKGVSLDVFEEINEKHDIQLKKAEEIIQQKLLSGN